MESIPSQLPIGEYHELSTKDVGLGIIYQRGEEFCIDAIVTNARGLHLRPSGALAEVATKYRGTAVTLEVGETALKIKDLMDIISCRVYHGSRITFAATGLYTTEVLNELYRTVLTINHRNYETPEEPEEY